MAAAAHDGSSKGAPKVRGLQECVDGVHPAERRRLRLVVDQVGPVAHGWLQRRKQEVAAEGRLAAGGRGGDTRGS